MVTPFHIYFNIIEKDTYITSIYPTLKDLKNNSNAIGNINLSLDNNKFNYNVIATFFGIGPGEGDNTYSWQFPYIYNNYNYTCSINASSNQVFANAFFINLLVNQNQNQLFNEQGVNIGNYVDAIIGYNPKSN